MQLLLVKSDNRWLCSGVLVRCLCPANDILISNCEIRVIGCLMVGWIVGEKLASDQPVSSEAKSGDGM